MPASFLAVCFCSRLSIRGSIIPPLCLARSLTHLCLSFPVIKDGTIVIFVVAVSRRAPED